MTKEMLASWGVEFDAINVAGNKELQDEVVRLGAPRVPLVEYNGKVVHGWNPAGYAKLLGIEYSGVPALTPEQLSQRLDAILARAQEWIRATPADKLTLEGPGRKRELRQLTFHMFRLSAAFVDSMEKDGLEEQWLQETIPADMTTGAAIAAFGDTTRAKVRGWFAAHGGTAWQEPVWTYYGDQSAHELLERTTWHAGQHFRQIHGLLSGAGVIPAAALDPALLAKLPMPKALW
jgi:glutaredoxin/uncharacterized damage-inducible protein DinB